MPIEEVAVAFNILRSDCLRVLQEIQSASSDVILVWDEKGSIICLEKNEQDAIVDYINSKGRFSITELTDEVNKIIRP